MECATKYKNCCSRKCREFTELSEEEKESIRSSITELEELREEIKQSLEVSETFLNVYKR